MASTSEVCLKLLIDNQSERVLFAEAGKDFVDFLFHIFALPLGTVASAVSKEKMVGCLGKLYGSIEDLNNTYWQPCANKDSVLTPKTPGCSSNSPLLLPGSSALQIPRTLYSCAFDSNPFSTKITACYRVADYPKAICPDCKMKMNIELISVPSANINATAQIVTGEGGGYVKGGVTYMITDDLQVKPMSTISSVTLIKTFNVDNLRTLDEKVVYLSMDDVSVICVGMQLMSWIRKNWS